MVNELKTKKILVICESPNKVRNIQKYLREADYKNVEVMASVGHITNIADNPKSYKNTGIYPEKNFKIDYAVLEEKQKVVRELKAAATKADLVYVCSDYDREGAQIGWSLVKFLGVSENKYRRMAMHEITPKAVVKAFENPIPFETTLVEAAQARAATDKMIGYSLSSFAKKHIGAKSVGRCQSVGLMLVADRENEILNFIPEKYFNLYLIFTKNSKEFKAKYTGYKNEKYDKIKTASEVKTIKYDCTGHNFTIEDVKQTKRQESPKLPFCTATFQQEAASKLGLKVKDAMSIVQKLYEAGFCTYLRTDDTDMSPEFLEELKTYVENTYGKAEYKGLRTKKTTNSLAQNGHECLRITDPALTPELFAQKNNNNLHIKVYTLIWQRTIASVLPNAVYLETVNTINNNDHKFTLTERVLVEPGFKTIYTYSDDSNEILTEVFTVGEVLENTRLEDIECQTKPKPRFTEASLVKELERLGIGRPSTFATIVETVLSPTRGYATLEGKELLPTDRGLQLAAYCKRAFPKLINLNYTREMEERLDKIASGELGWLDYMNSFYKNLTETIEDNQETGLASDLPEKLCPECGSPMVVRRSRFGRLFYGCSKFPACRGLLDFN